MTAAPPEPAPAATTRDGSRRIYAWWAVALSLLLALGFACRFVAWPVLSVRAVLRDHPNDAEAAIKALGGRERAGRWLELYLRLPPEPPPDRREEVMSLAGHCGRSGVGVLIRGLRDPEGRVRRQALSSLADIGPDAEAAVAPVAEFLSDESPSLRLDAADVLAAIGPGAREAVPALLKAFTDESALPGYFVNAHEAQVWIDVRPHFLRALASIGPAARDAVPALESLLAKPDQPFKQQIRETLQKIRGEGPLPSAPGGD